MDDFQWGYFILGLIAYQLLKMLAQSINQFIIERRQKKFIKLVNAKIPGKGDITFIAVDSSDKRALAKMERQLREKFDFDEDEDDPEDKGETGDLNLKRSRTTRYRKAS